MSVTLAACIAAPVGDWRGPGTTAQSEAAPSRVSAYLMYPWSLFAAIAYAFVYVVAMLAGLVTLPTNLSMARAVGGPELGIIPSGRNWPLSWASSAVYVALVVRPLLTKSGGSASAICAAVWVWIQCMVATSALTTFCTVSLCDATQSARAS